MGVLGWLGLHRWLLLSLAFVLLAAAFYWNVFRRRSRLNVAIFCAGALAVIGMAALTILR